MTSLTSAELGFSVAAVIVVVGLVAKKLAPEKVENSTREIIAFGASMGLIFYLVDLMVS